MNRKLEKEIMNNMEQVYAYTNANFSTLNKLFVDKLPHNISFKPNDILDLGCGSADISTSLVKANHNIKLTAVDASKEMLQYARKQIESLNLIKKVTLVNGKIPGLKKLLKDKQFDIILSKNLLHHLPQPSDFWEEIKNLAHEGTLIYVMDLVRPCSKSKAKKIVESVSGNEAKIFKKDFYNSLLAAFTIEEIKQQLKTANLKFDVKKINSRYFLVKGII